MFCVAAHFTQVSSMHPQMLTEEQLACWVDAARDAIAEQKWCAPCNNLAACILARSVQIFVSGLVYPSARAA